MTRTTLVALALALAACRGCAGPEAPDRHVVDRMVDPYAHVPTPGSVPALDRARAVLDEVGAQLGYGRLPGEVLAAHAKEPWARRVALLLAHGGTAQLEGAWLDLLQTTVGGFRMPGDLKLRARQAEARLADLGHAKADEKTQRHAWLAEIAWVLVLWNQHLPDAG